MRRMVLVVLAVVVGLYAAITVGYNVAQKPQHTEIQQGKKSQTIDAPGVTVETLWQLTNRERMNVGLAPLVHNPLLDASADSKCRDMVSGNYWAHVSPTGLDGISFIRGVTDYETAGENLADGYRTTEEVSAGWMNSESHKQNILRENFTDVGFAVCESQNFMGEGRKTLVVAHYIER